MADTPKFDPSRIGTTGLPVWGGRVFDEILRDLRDERGRRILREMSEQDPIIGGVLLGIEMLSRQVTWSIKPADDSAKAKKVAEFVDGALSDMHPTWENTLSEALSMLTYGWSWLEIVYKKRDGLDLDSLDKSSRFDDGKIGWAGWKIRSQETLDRWEFENSDDTGELVAMHQSAPPDYKDRRIPRSKSLHFTTRSRRENPEGISILRNSYRAWYMKKNIEQIEGIGIERDLAGLPVMWAPLDLFGPDLDLGQQALYNSLKKIVTNIRRDEQEGILMPLAYDEEGKNPLYKLELLSTGGERQFDTNAIVNRYDERIAMSMLADFILMGHQAVGSFALSTTKTGLFSTALSAILDLMAAEINLSAIPKLVLLNGWPLKMVPTLMHGNIESADLGKLGGFLKDLSAAGMSVFPNAPLEKFLLDASGLPADPGAGELPLPVQIDPTTGKPVLGPDGKPIPLPTPPQPPLLPGKTAPQLPLPQPPQPRPLPKQVPAKTASDPKKPARYVSLPTRIAKIASKLASDLGPDEYKDFLHRAMEAAAFSKLETADQELIKRLEAS